MNPSFRRLPAVFAVLCLTRFAALAAPTATNISPAPGNTVSTLTTVAVTFNEAVTGVDANDLLINNEGALTVSGSGAGPYTFSFTQPPPGAVSVSWDFDHGVAGLGTGAFVPGNGWSYTLTDTIAPAIAVTTPSANAILGSLTQAEVTFSEAVVGVDASDLLINGIAATAVTGEGAGPYLFTFSAPSNGLVAFTWAAAHGITDLAPTPNAFGGAGWNVTRTAAGAGSLVINEFLAANGSGLLDENGETGGWIEIHNPGGTGVNLNGWSLTNDPEIPGMWVFPSRTISAGAYLVVFASGKDRRPTSGNLHTNFTLNPNGRYLALFSPDSPRVAATVFNPYPPQRFDYSYGTQTSGGLRYFFPPKPSVANGTSTLTGITPKPNVSVSRGFFKDPFQVVLACSDANATIRYTLDGSVPLATTPTIYTAPLAVTGTTLLRAVAFSANNIPSETVTHSYIFLDQVLTQPSPPYDNPARSDDNSNPQLPRVGPVQFPVAWGSATAMTFPAVQITNLNTNQIPADYGMDPEIINDPNRYDDTGAINNATGKTNLERIKQGLRDLPMLSIVMKNDDMFGPAGLYPNSTLKGTTYERLCSVEMLLPDGSTGFASTCGIRIHGNASREPAKNPKHGFKLNFKGAFGASSLDYRLFTESPVEEFDDIILRGDFNSSWTHWDGATSTSGQRPRGTRIRDAWCKDTFRAMGRVAGHHRYVNLFINGLFWGTYDPTEQENNGFGAAYFGGKKDDYAVYEQSATIKSGVDTPLPGETTAPYAAMQALPAATTNATYEQYKKYLDVPWFIDYMLLHFYEGHRDWGDDVNKNWYAVRNAKQRGTFKYLPWDQENLLWDPADNRTNVPSPPSGLHPKLVPNAQYKLDFADRVHRHMVAPDGALLPAATAARWNKWRGILVNALAGESARWGDYRRDVHQFQTGPYPLYTWNGSARDEHNRLLTTYFPVRTNTVLSQLRSIGLYPTLNAPEMRDSANAPIASQTVSPGFTVRLQLLAPAPAGTTSAGTIYFTTDGSDPRVAFDTTGQRSPSAQAYTAPIALNATTTIKTRALNGTTWSALNEATFTIAPPGSPIRITEIMYHPPNGSGGVSAEFIEVMNTGASAVDLGGYSFSGVDFIFPAGLHLGPGARLVLANNNAPATFAATYPGVVVSGFYGGSLDNGGERLALLDARGRTVISVDYDDEAGWPTTPDGFGPSLEIIDPTGNPDLAANWKASNAAKGTPGQPNSVYSASSIVLNEVLARNAGGVLIDGVAQDFLELKNIGSTAQDLVGWSVTNGGSVLTFRSSQVLAPGMFLVIPCSVNGPDPRLRTPLDDQFGQIVLRTPEGAVADVVDYGNQIQDLSIGRVGGSWTLTTPTVGGENAAAPLAPAEGNIALNEWLALPFPEQPDWIEIFNRHASLPIALQGLYFQTETQLYRYPQLAFLAPRGFLQLVADEKPGALQLDFKLPAAGTSLEILSASGAVLDAVTRAEFGTAMRALTRGRLPDGATTFANLTAPSPNATNYVSAWTGPIFNEVLARGAAGDWVELHNPTTTAFDLSGYKLRLGNALSGFVWVFPPGSSIAPGEFLTLSADDGRPASMVAGPDMNLGVRLADTSGGLYLFNSADQLQHQIEWGMQVAERPIGLAAGGEWTLLATATPGSTNSGPAALDSPTNLRINEWLAASGGPLGDFLELFNPSPAPVALGGLFLTDDPSEVGRTKFQIAPLSFIAGQGWVKLHATGALSLGRDHVNFTLDASAENLRLSNNDAAVTTIDAVQFGQQLTGVSQGRITDGQTIRSILLPTPGEANVILSAPTITGLPTRLLIPQGGSFSLNPAVTSGVPTSFQWKFNSGNISGATGASYGLSSVLPGHDGAYTLLATNAAGSTTSSAVALLVTQSFAQWAGARGLAGAPADGDADGDGLLNAEEFFHNLDPRAATGALDRAALPRIGLEPATGTPEFLTLTYRRSARAVMSGVAYELSLNLAPGSWAITEPEVTESAGADLVTGDPLERVKFRLPPGTRSDFIRLRLTP